MTKKIILYVGFCAGICFAAEQLPSDIPRCKPGDVKCIAKVSTDLIQKYHGGRPDLGIPQLEPFHVDTVALQPSGPLRLGLTFSDLNVEGLSKLVIDKMVGFGKDPKTSKFEFTANIPKIRLFGKYKVNGRVLILPIQGDGEADVIIEKPVMEVKFKPHVKTVDGKNFVEIDKLKILLTPAKVSIHLTGLFNNNQVLGDTMNQFLNENWRDIWSDLAPRVYDAIGGVVRRASDGIFDRYSYDDIFLKE